MLDRVVKLDRLRRRAGVDMDNSPFGAESRWSVFISAHHRAPAELKFKPNSSLIILFPQYRPVDWRSLEVGKSPLPVKSQIPKTDLEEFCWRKCVGEVNKR